MDSVPKWFFLNLLWYSARQSRLSGRACLSRELFEPITSMLSGLILKQGLGVASAVASA